MAVRLNCPGAAHGRSLAAAFLLVTLIGTLLYGVAARDVRTFVLVPAIILAIAAIACYGPACRAAAIDPLTALKTSEQNQRAFTRSTRSHEGGPVTPTWS